MLIGLVKPRILLPDRDFVEDELRFIIKHELVHYARKDLVYKCPVMIATAIHWFNPIVYLIARAIGIDCEASCDTAVVKNACADARQHYCETIIGVVKIRSKSIIALSTAFYGGKSGRKREFSLLWIQEKTHGRGYYLHRADVRLSCRYGVLY
jgi:beta-lactamase regulating signal transducer with metallopeptidase domain